ncbi:LADA_0C10264g1_1 [Lachancea dasiensis]|uniref:LADA_0C10264g1_1 n=1 Tax=Lachancea dasiensis TaxID=1072105 RepID=A0A1G4J0W1_9SACH|nr:LADA_0C10264g1_1 [Lachancea dasiensis]
MLRNLVKKERLTLSTSSIFHSLSTMYMLKPFYVQKTGLFQAKRILQFSCGTFKSLSTRPIAQNIGNLQLRSPIMLGIAVATSLSLVLPQISSKHVIRSDTILDVKQRHKSLPEEVGLPLQSHATTNRRLYYKEMCLGSIVGLVTGVVVGKISTALVFIAACGLLGVQWLENRGLISKNSTVGLSKYVIKTGKDSVDFNTLIWNKTSFKVPFLITFILAAVNI